jgi:hypothetical protein
MVHLQRVEAVLRSRWFGHALFLAICGTVVALAFLLTPSTEQLSFFGWDVPVLCTFRRLTGHDCPGCGLTRSFVFLAHGQVLEAFRMNLLGPPAFVWVLAQLPWRTVRLWRIARG